MDIKKLYSKFMITISRMTHLYIWMWFLWIWYDMMSLCILLEFKWNFGTWKLVNRQRTFPLFWFVIGNIYYTCLLPHDQELQLGRNVKKRLNTKLISVFASPQLVPTRCHNVYFSNPSYIVNNDNNNNSHFGHLCIALINN